MFCPEEWPGCAINRGSLFVRLNTSASWQESVCLLCQQQNSLPSHLCVTVCENEGYVGCITELGSINAEQGEMTELNPSSKGRLEDVQVYFFWDLCAFWKWCLIHSWVYWDSSEKVCNIITRKYMPFTKKIRIVFKSMFSTITIDMDHWNTGNRINSRHLPSLSQPCLFDFHPFTNPRYFPSCLRENDSRDYFAGFFYCALLSFSVCSYH